MTTHYNQRSLLLIASLVLMFTSCGQQSRHNGTAVYGVDINGDTLTINASRSGAHSLSYSISGKPFEKKEFTNSISIDLVDLIKDDISHLNENAYTIATTGTLPIRFIIGSQLDTTIKVHFRTPQFFSEVGTKIISGPCLKLTLKSVSNSLEIDTKKWLYNRGTYADEATINKMSQILNILTSSSYDDYVPEGGKDIPVLTSFKGVSYRISTDIMADYYYLFAATEYAEIDDFIAETVSQDFKYAIKDHSASFPCFAPADKGGILTIFLVAINKDWSKSIVPLGLIAIDNINPHIYSDNANKQGVENILDLLERQKCVVDTMQIIKELNATVMYPKNSPVLSGWVNIATGQFRGDNAQFTISFSGDVESMTIKREVHRSYSWLSSGTKNINFSEQTSPMYFTYALDLGIGDNYIPITVKDKRGNITEYSYHIEMVQVEKTNPEINIDNNIDIWN